MEPALRLP
jgi:hypothetical protein